MEQVRSYSYIYKVQRIILLIFYTTTCIALVIPLAKLVARLSPDQLYPLFVALLLYVILVVIVGALIHVISYIPFNLANAFDPIQNDLASGQIETMDQFCGRITEFVVEFFSFAFLDITHAFVQIEGGEIISHDPDKMVYKVLNEYQMLQNSQALEGITRAGEISLPGGEQHLYILPIRFGNRWLGYMALLSRKKISRFFQRFLMEFEDNFLDQQVMLMIHCAKS